MKKFRATRVCEISILKSERDDNRMMYIIASNGVAGIEADIYIKENGCIDYGFHSMNPIAYRQLIEASEYFSEGDDGMPLSDFMWFVTSILDENVTRHWLLEKLVGQEVLVRGVSEEHPFAVGVLCKHEGWYSVDRYAISGNITTAISVGITGVEIEVLLKMGGAKDVGTSEKTGSG